MEITFVLQKFLFIFPKVSAGGKHVHMRHKTNLKASVDNYKQLACWITQILWHLDLSSTFDEFDDVRKPSAIL